MITRVWTGVVATEQVDEYVDDVRSEVVAFGVWESEAHLRAFTGDDIGAMVLYPEDEGFLLEPPTLVQYEVRSFHPADRTP